MQPRNKTNFILFYFILFYFFPGVRRQPETVVTA
jgi:hypothetical protein